MGPRSPPGSRSALAGLGVGEIGLAFDGELLAIGVPAPARDLDGQGTIRIARIER
ncbi:MAG: hypothetical protein K8H88_13270 [Sandaracinaceae bacterium]|nr:hypothetical protein [Sandaracinaceae bacterium]